MYLVAAGVLRPYGLKCIQPDMQGNKGRVDAFIADFLE